MLFAPFQKLSFFLFFSFLSFFLSFLFFFLSFFLPSLLSFFNIILLNIMFDYCFPSCYVFKPLNLTVTLVFYFKFIKSCSECHLIIVCLFYFTLKYVSLHRVLCIQVYSISSHSTLFYMVCFALIFSYFKFYSFSDNCFSSAS